MKDHHLHKIAIISVIIIILGLIFLGYDLFLDGTIINPVVKYNMPSFHITTQSTFFSPAPIGSVQGIYQVQTDKTAYYIGDEVYVILSFCKYRWITPIVRWQFINDIVGDLGYRTGQLYEPGCYTNKKVPIGKVPDEFSAANPGSKYQIHGVIINQVNPFRNISNLLVSNYFTIEK